MKNAGLQITGDKELKALLQQLPARVSAKGNRAAVTAASTPITRAAKANAPRQSGLLKKAIGKKVKTYKGTGGTAVAIIGAKRNTQGEWLGRKRVPANYIALVNKGTKHSKAEPFLTDAYTANKGKAVNAAAAKYAEVVEREAIKLGKR